MTMGAVLAFAMAAVLGGDPLLVAGSRAGVVELGAGREALHRVLGRPARTYARDADRVDLWGEGRELAVYYVAGVARQVAVRGKEWKTADGLGPGTSLAAWLPRFRGRAVAAYVSSRRQSDRVICHLDDRERGIAIVVTENGDPDSNVTEPFVLYALLVHGPGSASLPDADEVPAPRDLLERCRRLTAPGPEGEGHAGQSRRG